jgi:hypothetical protein
MEDLIFRCSGIRSSKEHICRFLGILLAQEPAASADENALVDRGEEDLLFHVEDVLGLRVRVLAPVYREPELRDVSMPGVWGRSLWYSQTFRQLAGPS